VLRITGSVLAHFHRHRQKAVKIPEAGGQLFARLLDDSIEIGCATGPYPDDERGRFWFRPNRHQQKADIKKQFKAGLHYVGDWHTHPVHHPTPSSIDLDSMRECFRLSRHELDSFVMVIVGLAVDPQTIWLSLHSESGYLRLSLVNPSDKGAGRVVPAVPDQSAEEGKR
jgi:integrative and conjugative element protein (TIGR02256 family)